MQLEHLKDLNIHIVGLSGAEGSAITEFLWNNKITNITAHDFCTKKEFVQNFVKFNPNLSANNRKEKLKIFNNQKLKKHFKNSYLTNIENADLIFVGQAWYKYEFNFPKLENAKNKNIPLKTIINLYLDIFPGTKIGITGSNGKKTVSALTNHIIKCICNQSKKQNVFISGNIDSESQSLDKISSASTEDIIILEISNRQLKLFGDSIVDIALVTNITENHLDEHDSLEEYANTKLRLCQKANRNLLNNKCEITKLNARKIKNPIWFNNKNILEEFELQKSDLNIPGAHNLENLYATLNIIKELNSQGKLTHTNEQIKKAVQSFTSIPKRLQIIGEKEGVQIVNDLSSTTPESTIKATEAFSDEAFSVVLGGEHKGGSYTGLIEKLKTLQENGNLKKIFLLPGSVREVIKSPNLTHPLKTTDVESFEEIAERFNQGSHKEIGDLLVISPSGEKVISVHLIGKNLKKIFL